MQREGLSGRRPNVLQTVWTPLIVPTLRVGRARMTPVRGGKEVVAPAGHFSAKAWSSGLYHPVRALRRGLWSRAGLGTHADQ